MNTLTLNDIANAIPKVQHVNGLLELLQQTREAERHLPLPDLLAVYLVYDLYDSASSDSANLRRIIVNLEAAMAELTSISHRLAGLQDD
jgi:hypothetical protein